jgi:hypothetical protein
MADPDLDALERLERQDLWRLLRSLDDDTVWGLYERAKAAGRKDLALGIWLECGREAGELYFRARQVLTTDEFRDWYAGYAGDVPLEELRRVLDLAEATSGR